jgi:hypothetical protein
MGVAWEFVSSEPAAGNDFNLLQFLKKYLLTNKNILLSY